MATVGELSAALVNADRAGDADAARMLAGEIQRMRGPTAAPRSAMEPASVSDVAKSGGVGIAKGGIGLLGLPGDLGELGARGIDRATQYIGGKLGVDVKPRQDRAPTYGSADIQKGIEGYTGEFYKPKSTAGEYAQTVGEFAPGLIGGGGVGALVRRAATQVALPGVASEAAGQYTKGTDAEPYARVAGALAGGLAPTAIGRAITPLPTSAGRQRLVDVLADEGVTSLTAGQRTGRPSLRYAESVLGDYPGAGSKASEAQQAGQRQFTEAAMRRAGAGPDATPEVLAANNARLGNEFETLSARNTLRMDPQFGNDIGRAISSYDRVPASQQRAIVEGYANDIMQHARSGGAMPGEFYQEMRSRLSRQSNSLRNSDPTLSETLGDLRDALDGAMRRSISPADREAWDTARRQYGAQKTIEKAASRAGAETAEGQIVPANLRNAVAGENRGAYARGEGQFSELARAGSGIMAPLPQSGTAPRVVASSLASALAGGAGMLHGGASEAGITAALAAMAGPAAGGRVLMSGPVQQYLGNQAAAPLLNSLNARQSALVNALLASNADRGPLRLSGSRQ